MDEQNDCLRIRNLNKLFSNGKKAVENLNVTMYTNQIFALLGHNGAGKTTTISMVTGLLPFTSGEAEVFGYDVFSQMAQIRQFMGVCPQHDILFGQLTPEEHLDLFADFKGLDPSRKKEEIEKILADVDLLSHRTHLSKNLSGGQKRKLSIGIALPSNRGISS